MVRSLLFLILGFIFGLMGAVIGLIWGDWKIALTVFLSFSCVSFVAASISLFYIRTLSWIDVFFPFIISIPWTLLLLPLKIPTQLFAAPSAIGAGLLLTCSLWITKSRGGSYGWLVLPVGIWLYEMLPISIPGPLDDLFALGSQATAFTLQIIKSQANKTLLTSGSQSESGNSQNE
jgi:hypothetical protein